MTCARHDAVEHVARRAAEDQRQAPQRVAVELVARSTASRSPIATRRHRGDHQQRGAPFRSGIVEDAERHAAILGVDDVEEAGDHVCGVEERRPASR